MHPAANPILEFKDSYEAAKGRLATALRIVRELMIRDPAAAEEIARDFIGQMDSIAPADRLRQLKEKFGMQERAYADTYSKS